MICRLGRCRLYEQRPRPSHAPGRFGRPATRETRRPLIIVSDTTPQQSSVRERVLDAVLAGGAFALTVAGGNALFLAGLIGLAKDYRADQQGQRFAERNRAHEQHLKRLDAASAGGDRISGPPLALIALAFETELAALWEVLESDDAMAQLKLPSEEYRQAAEELELLGLVRLDGNANHVTGIQRIRLAPTAVLRLGPTLFPQLDWADYVGRILTSLRDDREPERRFLTQRLLEITRIPLPRLELVLGALDALGIVEGHGPGGAHGSFWAVDITARGRRVLRGDEGVFG